MRTHRIRTHTNVPLHHLRRRSEGRALRVPPANPVISPSVAQAMSSGGIRASLALAPRYRLTLCHTADAVRRASDKMALVDQQTCFTPRFPPTINPWARAGYKSFHCASRTSTPLIKQRLGRARPGKVKTLVMPFWWYE